MWRVRGVKDGSIVGTAVEINVGHIDECCKRTSDRGYRLKSGIGRDGGSWKERSKLNLVLA